MRKIIKWSIAGIFALAGLAYAVASSFMYFGVDRAPWKLSGAAQIVVFVVLLAGGIMTEIPFGRSKKGKNADRT